MESFHLDDARAHNSTVAPSENSGVEIMKND